MKIILQRILLVSDGAFGLLLNENRDKLIAVTCEPTYDWLNIKIPKGVHKCTRTLFYKGGYDTYEVHIPEHSRILFHRGNVETDSDGCILVGKQFGRLNSRHAVMYSYDGFRNFMQHVGILPEFDLQVEEW